MGSLFFQINNLPRIQLLSTLYLSETFRILHHKPSMKHSLRILVFHEDRCRILVAGRWSPGLLSMLVKEYESDEALEIYVCNNAKVVKKASKMNKSRHERNSPKFRQIAAAQVSAVCHSLSKTTQDIASFSSVTNAGPYF